jgi:hypothetical protein
MGHLPASSLEVSRLLAQARWLAAGVLFRNRDFAFSSATVFARNARSGYVAPQVPLGLCYSTNL